MGSYTYGTLECYFDRRLTESEVTAMLGRVNTKPPDEWCKAHSVNQYFDIQYDWYNPENWVGDETYTDAYIAVNELGFEIHVETKAYDLVQAVEWTLESMPPDIWVQPTEAMFETEGEHWAIQVRRREARAVEAQLVTPEWKEDPLIEAAMRAAKGGEQ